jgi:RNA polymerase sigma-70 factor (ECF subfamily)
MDDLKIIDLYFERDENAIKETEKKYGRLCLNIATNVVGNIEDAKECVNDTYLGVWNAIPPARPNNFTAFICKYDFSESLSVYPAVLVQNNIAEIFNKLFYTC